MTLDWVAASPGHYLHFFYHLTTRPVLRPDWIGLLVAKVVPHFWDCERPASFYIDVRVHLHLLSPRFLTELSLRGLSVLVLVRCSLRPRLDSGASAGSTLAVPTLVVPTTMATRTLLSVSRKSNTFPTRFLTFNCRSAVADLARGHPLPRFQLSLEPHFKRRCPPQE